MFQTMLLIAGLLLLMGLVWVPWIWTRIRRKRLRDRPFPAQWQAGLAAMLPIYKGLSLDERQRLEGHIQVFLQEKQFIGCQGFQITAQVKLAIAGQACLLLLNERGQYFPRLASILVYPTAFVGTQVTPIGSVYIEGRQTRSGESSGKFGLVMLAWEHIQADLQQWGSGHNVVLHEFAHQLDQEAGQAEGVPILKQRTAYQNWARVFGAAFLDLQSKVQKGKKTALDPYGATAPAEFFAVATETFFEKPHQLAATYPELYAELEQYYQVQPKHWQCHP